jgi:hypothetical protein
MSNRDEEDDVKVEGAKKWKGVNGEVYMYTSPPTRDCQRCRKAFPWDGNDYKVYCTDCYQKIVRKCQKCKTANLPITSPLWKTTCTSCYLAGKEATHGTCPTCPPERATHLRRPLKKATCSECATRLRVLAPRVIPDVVPEVME